MTMFVFDSFTGDTNDDLVADHVGETGATWTSHPSYSSSDLRILGNRLGGETNGDRLAYASGTPAGVEYDVESTLHIASGSASSAWGICGRLSTSANTMYLLQYAEGAGAWRLFKGVGGSFTQLGTYSQSLSTGVDYPAKLEIRDAAKKVFIDGVERISSGDNAITAAGRVGVRHNGANIGGSGSLYDSFTATDAGGGEAVDMPQRINQNFTATGSYAAAQIQV